MMKSHLTARLQAIRAWIARSDVAARGAAYVGRQMAGIVHLHLGHDVNPQTNGEAWIVRELASTTATFIDVGANVGDWTAMVLDARGTKPSRGLLFEPGTEASSALHRRFGDVESIEVVTEAATSSVGEMTFYEEPGASVTSSLVAGFGGGDARARVVRTTTLDEAIRSRPDFARVDYLKIDAEGHDLQVLLGARESLARQAIRFVQFEYNEPWRATASTLAHAIQFLDGVGYDVLLLSGRGLRRFPFGVYGEFYGHSNFVALPRSRREELGHLVVGTA